ncbi:uncharacterized protein [Procambarus clarkii]|uniref:uncharacterized protein n=1 Tax=Procambarus clarkii TaxID=6728 RepID=UPI00374488DD
MVDDSPRNSTPRLKSFSIQEETFPALPTSGAASGAQSNYWTSNSSASHSQPQTTPLHQASQPSLLTTPSATPDSTVAALIHFATELSGGDLKQRYRILNELYKVNQLPTFVIPEDMFPTCSSQPEASNITISSTALADILSADAHPVQPATDSAISLHTATPDEPSTSPVVPETTPASLETTPAAPETTPASQVPTPDASANQHLSSDDDSTASVDVEAQSPSPATEESPRVSKSLRTI